MCSTAYLVPLGVWFGAGNICVYCVADPLPKWHTSRICEGHEDFPSCKVVLEANKFKEKPSESEYFLSFNFFSSESLVQEQSLYPSLRMHGAG